MTYLAIQLEIPCASPFAATRALKAVAEIDLSVAIQMKISSWTRSKSLIK